MPDIHPCQKCGACCTVFQVSFNESETLISSYQVPIQNTVKISADILALKFKNPDSKRCCALTGHIGKFVNCEIYQNRPSPCRNFKASYENGVKNPRCDEARKTIGLAPLEPHDWKAHESSASI